MSCFPSFPLFSTLVEDGGDWRMTTLFAHIACEAGKGMVFLPIGSIATRKVGANNTYPPPALSVHSGA